MEAPVARKMAEASSSATCSGKIGREALHPPFPHDPPGSPSP